MDKTDTKFKMAFSEAVKYRFLEQERSLADAYHDYAITSYDTAVSWGAVRRCAGVFFGSLLLASSLSGSTTKEQVGQAACALVAVATVGCGVRRTEEYVENRRERTKVIASIDSIADTIHAMARQSDSTRIKSRIDELDNSYSRFVELLPKKGPNCYTDNDLR